MILSVEDDRHFKLEFGLLSSIKTETSVIVDEGSETNVCNMLTYSDPSLYVLPTILWSVKLNKIKGYKDRNPIQFVVSDPVLTFSPFRELFQENVRLLFDEYSDSGKISKPTHPVAERVD